MKPLTETDVRSSFVNLTKGATKRLNLPTDLAERPWDDLDYLGWQDPKAPQNHYLVAEHDGSVRGFVKLSIAEKPWGLSCEMDTLVVDEGWRGRGIGKELLVAAEDHAVEIGARGLRADVLASNEEGRAFYEREGYSLVAVRYGKSITGQEERERL
jgi:ribosomal protein S18 acetylase RimI-like enzyme